MEDVTKLSLTSTTRIAKDIHDRPVLLFANDWSIHWATDNNEGLRLSDTAIR